MHRYSRLIATITGENAQPPNETGRSICPLKNAALKAKETLTCMFVGTAFLAADQTHKGPFPLWSNIHGTSEELRYLPIDW